MYGFVHWRGIEPAVGVSLETAPHTARGIECRRKVSKRRAQPGRTGSGQDELLTFFEEESHLVALDGADGREAVVGLPHQRITAQCGGPQTDDDDGREASQQEQDEKPVTHGIEKVHDIPPASGRIQVRILQPGKRWT